MASENILEEIAAEIAQCTKCPLSQSRKNTVPGEGPTDSEIMFIGEGPGFYENEQGLPFVGPAGKFLDELLNNAGLKREQVYITNVLKCRPPGNRDPQEEELNACRDYLERQIMAIKPKVIVTLGRHSMARYFKDVKISMMHGQATWIKGQLVVPMYHPAAGLHQPSLKAVIRKDFEMLPAYIQKARKANRSYDPFSEQQGTLNDHKDPTQLSFF
ncbi:MAG TPA: uracil-DNA glycosylase [Anaerolineae bacterium]|nr:uracil-DNA glycosylase [Anaerolineae bacterium]